MASLKFCAECNNLLYPEADRTNHVLLYACRNCPYRTEASNPLVFRNDLKLISKEQPGVIDELMTDPTLRRTQDLTCPNCGHTEAVMFQDQSKRDLNKMIFFYVCCYCNHLFRDDPLERPPEETE
ncbi:dna-directed rna polymerase ii kda polypeptide [Malassezia pachydermatis]|uniref:DNA-directed RNA polymerase subunit n=1 Tax=Malassezia pachydermatis TaxID=77020 RepID=A0A0M9VR28_9BASI|nr:dna-directed rna polymerase ii kda polypeptide [Malassezia pachydermatis]KOS16192.1 dna-directed rna polymerase ii kda polypeptide [Malassezia pachydermatis]